LSEILTSPAARADSPLATILKIVVGVITTILGVFGFLVCAAQIATGAEPPPPLDALLPIAELSGPVFGALSLAGAAGAVLWLRGLHVGSAICSGTWAVLAALAIRPDLKFNYAEGPIAQVDFPAQGQSAAMTVLFFVSAGLAALIHWYSIATEHARARLESTTGEMLGGAFLLVAGLTAAMRFQTEARASGEPAYEHALIACLIVAVCCEAIGLGLLLGFAAARALAIAVFLGIAASALLPDLLFDRLRVPAPILWAPLCFVAAITLFVPRRNPHFFAT
jgi:hypothetical protein